MKFLQKLSEHPWLIAVCGFVVALPTLWAGWFMDDVLVRVKLLGLNTPWSPAPWWDLYTFARPDINAKLLAAGHHPWWADPAVKMTFFRPLAAATHVLDYLLWPSSPAMQHLHSVLWYGLAVFMAFTVFQRIHKNNGTSKVVVIAGMLFAVAPPHVMAVGWIAGRNTIMAFVLACLVIHAHLLWRESKQWKYLALALLLLVTGFLTSEAVLGGLGYVVAWQLCRDSGSWKDRLLAIVPYALVVVVWRVMYVKAGFGAAGTSIYRDPATDLMGTVEVLFINFPILLFGRWVPVPLDLWAVLPPVGRAVFLGLTLAFFGLLLAFFWSLLKKSPKARFWGIGMLLSLVPFTLTLPMDRLGFFAGLGMAGLLALMTEETLERPWLRRTRTTLLWLHLPIAACLSLFRAGTLFLLMSPGTSGVTQAPQDKLVSTQTFVYVSGTFHRTHYTTLIRKAAGNPAVPRRSVVLNSLLSGATIVRKDKHTLEVTPDGGFMKFELDRIHRRVTKPFRVGDVVKLPDLQIRVMAITSDGRPARVFCRFKKPLEDPSYRWLVVQRPKDATRPFEMKTMPFKIPAIGKKVVVAPAL